MKDQIAWSYTVTLSGRTAVTSSPAGAVLVDTAGLLTIEYANGKTDTVQLVAGVWHKIEFVALHQSGTTAAGIHVGYLK